MIGLSQEGSAYYVVQVGEGFDTIRNGASATRATGRLARLGFGLNPDF